MKVATPSPSAQQSRADRDRDASNVGVERDAERSFPGVGDGWHSAQALFEEARRRRRRRHLWGTIVVLLGVVLVAVSVWSLSDGTPSGPGSSLHRVERPHPVGTVDARLPPTMVVWAQLSRTTMAIQVVSSRTGRVMRTLATDDGLFNSTPQPTVSTDGTVFYDDSVPGSSTPGPGSPPPIERVMAVPLAGGPVTFVAPGHDPVVSPNGQDLAYLTFSQVITKLGGDSVVSDAPEGIVVRNLLTGASSTWSYSTSGPDIRRLSWFPDSTHLAFSTEDLVDGKWHLSTRVIGVSGGDRRLEDARTIPLPRCPAGPSWAFGTDHTMAFAGLLNEDRGIGVCRHVDITGTEQSTQLLVIDIRTGHEVAKLPAIPGLIGDGPGGGVQVDPSGRYMAYIGPGLGAGGLYRWALDRWALKEPGRTTRPVLVRQHVGSVGWVPASLGGSVTP
jgi:hypothetical protein